MGKPVILTVDDDNIVVLKHRGRIAVDSKPGRTTFRVFPPLGRGSGGSAGSSSS